jgi:hypothetical protein
MSFSEIVAVDEALSDVLISTNSAASRHADCSVLNVAFTLDCLKLAALVT